MNLYILMTAIVILACVLCNRISSKLGIPMLLIFILLGMFFGSDGVVRIAFDNFRAAEQICSVALIFIMFYGGFGTKWSAAKPVVGRAVLLSTAGVVLTAGFTGLFCHFILQTDWAESFLIGALVSSTDAASVFSILRSRRLNLKYHTASLLEVESGSNDPCAYMLTTIILGIMSGSGMHAGAILYSIFAQAVFGILAGVAAAYITSVFMKKFEFTTEGFDTVFVFGMVLLTYAIPSSIGGNGYLAVYIFGIIFGNRKIKNKKSLVHFFDGVTGLMQMLLFFLLGLLAFPSQFLQILLPAAGIALFLTFIARPLAVFVLLTPFHCRPEQQIIISAAGLRGAASIVFAIMAVTSEAKVQHDVFHIVFFIVLFSILLQGTLLPVLSRKLHMIDEKEDVLKTFTDYTEEVPVQFIQFSVTKDHPWAGSRIQDIMLPPETLLVQICKKGKNMAVPEGSTVLQGGDVLVLSAKAPVMGSQVHLTELELKQKHEWIGKQIAEVSLESGKLIVMIRRKEDIVIPNGRTCLMQNDILVIREN